MSGQNGLNCDSLGFAAAVGCLRVRGGSLTHFENHLQQTGCGGSGSMFFHPLRAGKCFADGLRRDAEFLGNSLLLAANSRSEKVQDPPLGRASVLHDVSEEPEHCFGFCCQSREGTIHGNGDPFLPVAEAVDSPPGIDKAVPGSVFDKVGKGLVDGPDADSHVPLTGAEGDQCCVNSLVAGLDDALHLILNRTVEVEPCRNMPQVLEELGHEVAIPATVALVDGQSEHSGSHATGW